MPELPEVEFCGRALYRWLGGQRIVGVEVVDFRSVRASRTSRPSDGLADGAARLSSVVAGKLPERPIRHGKRLYWGFGEHGLLLHLGMTGKWTRKPTKFAKVRLQGESGEWVSFSDPRLLGGVVPCSKKTGLAELHAGLGPDALNESLPPLTGKRPVKLVLMDQAVIAGLGNLHAAEALWRAKVDPRAPASEITRAQHKSIAAAIQTQLRGEITAFEAEDEITYVEDAGADNPFPVYGQAGKNCPLCSRIIERFVQAGRSTYWCPGCQSSTSRRGRA